MGEGSNEFDKLTGDSYRLVELDLPTMVPDDDEFDSFFFQGLKVVYYGCIQV